MYCWKCKTEQDLPDKKVPFRMSCSNCGFDLHVCKNCKHYAIGKPHDCNIPDIELVADKERFNFCEEFSYKTTLDKDKTVSSHDVAKKLFNEEAPPKKDFKSLFDDD